jgi:hypothetical protein
MNIRSLYRLSTVRTPGGGGGGGGGWEGGAVQEHEACVKVGKRGNSERRGRGKRGLRYSMAVCMKILRVGVRGGAEHKDEPKDTTRT